MVYTRKMGLALQVKFCLDSHWATRPWGRTLTNGSDVTIRIFAVSRQVLPVWRAVLSAGVRLVDVQQAAVGTVALRGRHSTKLHRYTLLHQPLVTISAFIFLISGSTLHGNFFLYDFNLRYWRMVRGREGYHGPKRTPFYKTATSIIMHRRNLQYFHFAIGIVQDFFSLYCVLR